MKNLSLRILLILFLLAALIQLVPVNRKNPPVTQDIAAPPPVAAILRTSCYDCHSNETRWPLYSYIAPVSWFIADDVKKGRMVMNFSRWNAYSKAEQESYRSRCYAMVSEGLMPLPDYLRIHRDARLDSLKVGMLRRWSLSLPGGDSPGK